MTKAEQVVQFARSKLGCGYVWGAKGQILTEKVLKELKAAAPTHIDVDVVKKWLNQQVFDCAGLVQQAMATVGIKMAGGATTAWNNTKWLAQGEIKDLPKDKVCCLYRATSPTNMQHTGIYLGNGTFIDSRGSKEGVIGPTKLSRYAWTHWGIPLGLYDTVDEVIKVAYSATVTASAGSTVNMRTSPSVNSTKIVSIAVGQKVDVIATTGEWSQITWNGKTGYMMSKYLTKVNGSENNNSWYIKIECDSEAQAKAIATLLAKAKATT